MRDYGIHVPPEGDPLQDLTFVIAATAVGTVVWAYGRARRAISAAVWPSKGLR